MKPIQNRFALLAILLCANWVQAADAVAATENLTMTTTDGKQIQLNEQPRRHLVFMDIFASYLGQGAELQVQQLPDSFGQHYPLVWVQPHLNVTRAQLEEFQQLFPAIRPMVLDDELQWMQHFKVWSSPYHVLMRDGEVEFAGDYSALRQYLKLPPVPDPVLVNATPMPGSVDGFDYHYLEPGDAAPSVEVTTMDGQRINLANWYRHNQGGRIVFLDSLCPMPHFPGCEQQLQQLSQQLKQSDQGWLGVVSGFYVSPDVVQDFLQRFDLSLPVVFDHGNQLFGQFGVLATPYVVEVDRQGHLAQRQSLAADL